MVIIKIYKVLYLNTYNYFTNMIKENKSCVEEIWR